MVAGLNIIADLPPPPVSADEAEEETFYEEQYQVGPVLSEFDWRSKLRSDLVGSVEKWAEALGVSKFALDSLVRDNMDGALKYITENVVMPNTRSSVDFDVDEGIGKVTKNPSWSPDNAKDWEQIWNAGLLYFSALSGVDLANIGKNSGRGSGSRGPSAADIRNSFDIEQLTDAVQNLWGAYLLEDTKDARKIAKNYIDAIVASGGQKEIDFKTFVLGRMEGTARWDQIYQNKPEGQDPLQYIGPYVSMTNSVIGGGQGDKALSGSIAAGGAALGASQDAFAQRLQRTDAHTSTSGFINGIEGKVRGVSNVLRG